jgi:pimeloyl-ACP methyl ester carboxylesterase
VVVDAGPDLDARGVTRIRLDAEGSGDASFASVAEYERALARAYPAAGPDAVARMARHGLRRRDDGRFERKTDPAYFRALPGQTPEAMAARERETTAALWAALGRIECPTLVIRGAASDILDPDCAERMAEEVLRDGRLAVVAQAGHSVMTDNPAGFRDAVAAFALG